METKFDVDVQLTGTDGNAFAILGKVSNAILAAGGTNDDLRDFQGQAMASDYDHLLRTCMEWVNVK